MLREVGQNGGSVIFIDERSVIPPPKQWDIRWYVIAILLQALECSLKALAHRGAAAATTKDSITCIFQTYLE